jgi:hypothetical protein
LILRKFPVIPGHARQRVAPESRDSLQYCLWIPDPRAFGRALE